MLGSRVGLPVPSAGFWIRETRSVAPTKITENQAIRPCTVKTGGEVPRQAMCCCMIHESPATVRDSAFPSLTLTGFVSRKKCASSLPKPPEDGERGRGLTQQPAGAVPSSPEGRPSLFATLGSHPGWLQMAVRKLPSQQSGCIRLGRGVPVAWVGMSSLPDSAREAHAKAQKAHRCPAGSRGAGGERSEKNIHGTARLSVVVETEAADGNAQPNALHSVKRSSSGSKVTWKSPSAGPILSG